MRGGAPAKHMRRRRASRGKDGTFEQDCGKDAGGHLEACGSAGGARIGGRRGVRRHLLRGARRGLRRDLLQHLDGRLFGNRHRSLLCGADRGAHLSAGGQLRRERRRRPGGASGPAGARGARHVPHALQLAQPGEPRRLSGARGRRGHRGRRHPRARAPYPRPWRPAGRRFYRGHRCRLAAREGAPESVACGREPGRRRVLRRRLLLHRREPARFPWLRPGRPGRAPLQGGRLPLRREALHLGRSGGLGLRAYGGALGHPRRRGAGDESRRRVPFQRPGRPGGGGGDLPTGGEVAGEGAAVRHLPGSPDDGQGFRRGDREARSASALAIR